MDWGPVGGPAGALDEYLMPSDGETVVADPDVDIAAPVGLNRDSEVSDDDLGPGSHFRGGDEITPSATVQQVCRCLNDPCILGRTQHNPREDTNLSGGAETSIRGDAFLPAAA